ncbi:MAG: MBL fold metallo-hydrolase [Candidatus Deferrimicrobiaceae bacterium]
MSVAFRSSAATVISDRHDVHSGRAAMDVVTPDVWVGRNLHEVVPDILQFRLPLDIGLDHSNVYLIREDAGWCAFDTGIDSKEGRDIWSAALDGPLKKGITRIVVSHHHIDHIGLAAWLQETTGAPVYVRPEELTIARTMLLTDPDAVSTIREHITRSGFSAADVDRTLAEFIPNYYQCILPKETRMLEDGQRIGIGRRLFEVLVTGGHSVAQVALYDPSDGLFVSGDQMLEWITPNVSLWPFGDKEPLASFLSSLDRIDSRHIRIILPAHHKVYAPSENRVEALRVHHRQMLTRFREQLQGRMSGFELGEAVYGTQPDFLHRILALLETLSHLQWLQKEGTVARHDDGPISRYERVIRRRTDR